MKTRDFSFELPPELIAQHPAERRGGSRLMCLNRTTGTYSHHTMGELPALLPDRALLVLNDSRVRKARLYGTLPSGKVRELLFLRRVGKPVETGEEWEVMCRRASRLGPGTVITLPGGPAAEVSGPASSPNSILLSFPQPLEESYFNEFGHVPLPPYIRREDEPTDAERYQTVYAAAPGSVAAPTAGLHLTEEVLDGVTRRGIGVLRLTLHVGPGTFLPVRSDQIDDHVMHSEEYDLPPETAEEVNAALVSGRPVVAVGTTSVRTLEAAYDSDLRGVRSGRGSTDIFIRPGYRFNVVSGLLTNFHTPESTLLMLVSAFATREIILDSYKAAIEERYRFFSYGDAMLIQ